MRTIKRGLERPSKAMFRNIGRVSTVVAGWLCLLSFPLHADILSLQPGLYETRVAANGSGRIDVDRSCVTPDEAKDVIDYMRSQSESGGPCRMTKADVKGRHLSARAVCKLAGPQSSNVDAESEFDFTGNSFIGTVHNTAQNVEGRPFDEVLIVSVKRVGNCS